MDRALETEIEEAIFEVALALDDAVARHEFLKRAFRGNPEGLRRMEGLLETARDATSFFLEASEARGLIAAEWMDDIGDDAFDVPVRVPSSQRIGSAIGDYRLIRCLGEGGSGVVYEAEQMQPVQRRVALKIIRFDAGSEAAKARFEIERQALAIMDHPNIAKVLDAGGVHQGSPFFVMELVEGIAITGYCDRERLNLRQRLELFIDVCGAIQHAHAKRIIHRDLKPGNVLVSGPGSRPLAKVIDFGIAKPVAADFQVKTSLTAHDQFIGTPAYMSPEQVEMIGVDVDTRSDVYSLGALLYELLTSHTPFDRQMREETGMAAVRRIILDEPPVNPSVRLSEIPANEMLEIAAARQTDGPHLLTGIRGDLDWIVLKALEKDRNHRYETVSSLALDLRRFLENKPVTARRPSNLYTFGKFVRRNRIPFFSGVAVAISILLGLGAATTLYLRERAALDEQQRLSLEAEAARDQELKMRRQAQARANISRVAFLLGEGKVKEADELLQQNPLVSIEPSKEASSVFRTLGNWYATYGRWSEAVQCFRLMKQATHMNRPEEILRSTDLLITGPALLELGDRRGYQTFREEAAVRYLPVTNSLGAEHVLKAFLLEKAPPELMMKLEGAANLCEQSIRDHGQGSSSGWEAFSLSLYYYRKGDFGKVTEIGALGLATPEIREICAAGIRTLMAVAHHKLGNQTAAMEELKLARSVIHQPRSDDASEEKIIFYKWYDRSSVSLLLKEAEGVLKKAR